MNKIEKSIYNLVKKNPAVKNQVRNLYQKIFDMLPRKKEYFINPIEYKEAYFFGFHDLCPFSQDEKMLLANRASIFTEMPKTGDLLAVGYFDFSTGKFGDFVKIGESSAWNYHKGCRLQWLGKNAIIYNTAVSNKLISRIINIHDRTSTDIDFPIDTVSADGKFGSSFSYERLENFMPGYGYNYKDDSFLDESAPKNSGLFLVDLSKNTAKLLVSLYDLAQNSINCPESKNSRHYVTHSEFSYDGRYIAFLHRWVGPTVQKRRSRLLVFDIAENQFIVFPTEQMVSHYVWNRQNQIIAYCRIDDTDCHVLFNVPDINNYKKVPKNILNSDGHQSFINNNSFITDTYPDKFRMANIYQVNIDTDKVKKLAAVYSPKEYQTINYFKHIACDLHPRISPKGTYVCFDSPRTGKRALCVMPINDLAE